MNTRINLAGIVMKNPVMTASGTFGYGREYSEFFDLNKLGALVTKAVTLTERRGNAQPRICETSSGLINSIGLQNPGKDYFLQEAIPFLEKYQVPLIVNLSERSIEDFAEAARVFSIPRINALEVNISCPNVKSGGLMFGIDSNATRQVIKAVRENTKKPIIAKLSPNVTNIVEIAKAAYESGADALSMINTLLAMNINPDTGKFILGGLSGPAIKPIGVRCVYQVYKSGIPLPIIGMGGIANASDAIEYIRAGATAIAIGTETLRNPLACLGTIAGLEEFMEKHKIEDIQELRGQVSSHF
jgi:dihydroorotate dehydrogenase (NAD+) catalytic subunit